MGLANFLFSSKKKSSDSQASPASSPVRKPITRADIDKQALVGKYERHRNKYVTNKRVRGIRSVEINGEIVDKKRMKKLFANISKRTKRDVNVKDIESYFKNAHKYKSDFNNSGDIDWQHTSYAEKQRMLKYFRKQAKLAIPKQTTQSKTSSLSSKEINANMARQEARKARRVNAQSVINEQKFISPKNQLPGGRRNASVEGETAFSRLNIHGAKEGYQGNHIQNPENMGMNKSGSSLEAQSRGLTQTGNASLTGRSPGRLGDNKVNLNNRPRIGGL